MILAFLLLGLLVGNLIGLSAQSIVVPFLGLVFALAGGSLIAFLEKLTGPDRILAANALAAFCAAALVGAYFGIFASEWQLLSPERPHSAKSTPTPTSSPARSLAQTSTPRPEIADRKYLRRSEVNAIQEIDRQVQANRVSKSDAYEDLFQLCTGSD